MSQLDAFSQIEKEYKIFQKTQVTTRIKEKVMEHELLRRIVVFPFKVNLSYYKSAEDAWWKLRSELTKNQRFLVASKNFMISKDVFQSRQSLDIADTLILGKLLDAQALVVTEVHNRVMKMIVYDGKFGGALWQHEILLNNTIPISAQLESESLKLIRDFIASIPYQGYVQKKDFTSSAIYKKGNRHFFKAFFADTKHLQKGDQVNVIRVIKSNFLPLFQQPNIVTIIAVAEVAQIEKNTVEIELKSAVDAQKIIQGDLLNISKEYQRLRNDLELAKRRSLEDAIYDPDLKRLEPDVDEKRPLVSALTFIGTLAIFLLMAF